MYEFTERDKYVINVVVEAAITDHLTCLAEGREVPIHKFTDIILSSYSDISDRELILEEINKEACRQYNALPKNPELREKYYALVRNSIDVEPRNIMYENKVRQLYGDKEQKKENFYTHGR